MEQEQRARRDLAGAEAADPGGASALPGAVVDPATAARTLELPASDVDFLLQLAAHAGLPLDRARAEALAPQVYAAVAVVRHATPLRRDQIAPATVFRPPRGV